MLRAKCGAGVLVFISVLVGAAGVWSQEYIVMGTPMVNIRTGPSTDHVIVGRAEKGDIFRVIESEGDWLRIAMFTADHRYVFSASYVYPLMSADLVPGHRMKLTDSSEDTRRSLYRSLQQAKGRAQREADEIIPVSVDEERNTSFRRIMEDRIILEMMHIYEFQPALHKDLVDEAQKSSW